MYNSMWYQSVLFAVFFAVGMVCALVFDTFRVSERFVRSAFFVSILKDILFWLVVTVLMFAICLKFNNGEIRFFMFVGVFAGALTYFNTLSKYVLNALYFVINFFKKIITFVFKILFMPLKFILKLVNKPVFIALSFSKRSIINFGKKVRFKFKIFKKFKR